MTQSVTLSQEALSALGILMDIFGSNRRLPKWHLDVLPKGSDEGLSMLTDIRVNRTHPE